MNIIVIVILERGDCVCGLHLYIQKIHHTYHTIVFALIERISYSDTLHFRMHTYFLLFCYKCCFSYSSCLVDA